MLIPQNINVYKSSEVFADAHKEDVAVDGIWGYIEGEDLSRGDRERLESLLPGSYIDLEN